MQNGLHLTLTPFRNESRILKETAFLTKKGFVQHIFIVALHELELSENEDIDSQRSVWRIRLKVRNWPNNLWSQLIKYIEFCIRVIGFSRQKHIKLINVHHLDLLPLGVLLKLIYRTKLVYDTHELETERHGLKGVRQTIAKCIERLFIYQADLVIVVSDGINVWYRNKYRLSKIVTVLNCPDFQKPKHTHLLHHELGIPENKKITIYQGGLSPGRGVEALLKAFGKHDDNKHVLVLMGDGELETLVKEYANANCNIFYRETVATSEVLKYTASADIGISYIEETSISYRLCLPNKLFEYIMANLPVIVSNLPEMRRVVVDNKIGVVLDELTVDSLSTAINEIEQLDIDILKNNLKTTSSVYSWQKQELVMTNAYRDHVYLTHETPSSV